MTWATFLFFLYFFMFTDIGIPDIERGKRKRNLLIGQPQGSLSERIDTQCAFVDLKITFSCVCDCQLYPAVM